MADKAKKPDATEPFEGYDAMDSAAIIARLPDLDDVARGKVLAYERSHRNREDVVTAYVNWNS